MSGNGAPDQVAQAKLKLDFEGTNPDGGALMALYGMPALPLGTAGQARTTLTVEGTFAGGLKSTLDFEGDDMQASFDGTLQIGDSLIAAKGPVHLEAADIEPWLMTTGWTRAWRSRRTQRIETPFGAEHHLWSVPT